MQPFYGHVLETFHHPAFSAAPVVAAPEKKKERTRMSVNYKKAISDLIARLTCLGLCAFLRTTDSMLHTASQTSLLYKLVNCI